MLFHYEKISKSTKQYEEFKTHIFGLHVYYVVEKQTKGHHFAKTRRSWNSFL